MPKYDQRNQHVNQQFNFNLQNHQSLDPIDTLNQGVQLLEAKSYQQAVDLLRETIRIDSSLTVVYYYLALALLGGKRPKVLKRSQIEEIDQLLLTAIAMGDSDGTLQWFRALMRYDYYVENRMKCPSPSVSEIISQIDASSVDYNRLRTLLIKLSFMANNQLYCDLVTHIM